MFVHCPHDHHGHHDHHDLAGYMATSISRAMPYMWPKSNTAKVLTRTVITFKSPEPHEFNHHAFINLKWNFSCIWFRRVWRICAHATHFLLSIQQVGISPILPMPWWGPSPDKPYPDTSSHCYDGGNCDRVYCHLYIALVAGIPAAVNTTTAAIATTTGKSPRPGHDL